MCRAMGANLLLQVGMRQKTAGQAADDKKLTCAQYKVGIITIVS
jgi:hypothetical protein